jgi:signal peptide peptidase SppA
MDKSYLSRFASEVVNTPLMILPDKLHVIMAAIGHRIGLNVTDETVRAELGVYDKVRQSDSSENTNVSVIPVYGSLVYRTHGMDAMSGLRSYDAIRNDFRAALYSGSEAILFDINSPGGAANGLMDLVDEIYESRGDKPIYAVANEFAFSAGYAIASAADKIFVSRTSGIGSVGCIAIHADQSKFDEKLGVKYTTIFAGARKNDLNPHQPLSDEAKAILEEEVADHYELFASTVARNRGMKLSQVKATNAGIYTGEKGVSVGFADEVLPFNAVLKKVSGGDVSSSGNAVIVAANAGDDGVKNIKPLAKEEQEMNVSDLKKDHPDVYQSVKDEVFSELKDGFERDKKEFEIKLSEEKEMHEKERAELFDKVSQLEKREAIRREKELKLEAKEIWATKLSASDIPERLYDKVVVHVSADKFIKDGDLDRDAFGEAVDAEIEDWAKLFKEETQGFGLSVKTVENSEASKEKKLAEDDDAAVKELLALANDPAAKA